MKTLKQTVDRIYSQTMLAVITGYEYSGNWSNDDRVSEIDETIKLIIQSSNTTITCEMLDTATHDELVDVGFKRWNKVDVNGNVLLLMPIALLPFVDKNYQVSSISYLGDTHVTKAIRDIDNDHRGGILAYGILRKFAEPKINNNMECINMQTLSHLKHKDTTELTRTYVLEEIIKTSNVLKGNINDQADMVVPEENSNILLYFLLRRKLSKILYRINEDNTYTIDRAIEDYNTIISEFNCRNT